MRGLAPSKALRTPSCWSRDWKTRWNGLRRYRERQWTWNASGAPDDWDGL